MKRSLVIAAAIFSLSAGAAAACDPGKPGSELGIEEAKVVYDCLSDRLYDGYNKGDKGWIPASFVADYRNW